MSAWHPWFPLPTPPCGRPITRPDVLAEVLDGGQSFRWRPLEGGAYEGGWGARHVRVRLARDGAGALEFSAPAYADPAECAAALRDYLAGPPADEDALPWRSDPHLAACMAAFPGLRILRQPFGEALLGFVCSATKQIVQIKRMLELVAARHGRPAGRGDDWNRLPNWDELARVAEDDLRACGLGFRARHVAGIARRLAAEPGWLEATERAPYAEAKIRLLELPGVGEKVADCVLLFGAGRLEAFPVDTWIIKAMERRYGLAGWPPAQIAHFGRMHFGAQAGLAQQYLFAYERALGR